MKEDKIDKIIKSKLDSREIPHSNSAWERLSSQLDDKQHEIINKQKVYFSYAASMLLLLSIGFSYFKFNSKEKIKPILVNTKLETVKTDTLKAVDEIIKEEKIQMAKREYISIPKSKIENKKSIRVEKVTNTKNNKENLNKIYTEKDIKVETLVTKNENSNVGKEKNRIKVSGKDLLFAVTHNVDEVKKYYTKHNLNRNKIINTIERELRKSNLKINPETILAEVENDLINDQFKGGFMHKIKLKISDIAVAVADRNK